MRYKFNKEEYSEVMLKKNQLYIWGTDMLITRGKKDSGKDCISQVSTESIERLIKVLSLIEDQPIVLVFDDETSYLSLRSIDL